MNVLERFFIIQLYFFPLFALTIKKASGVVLVTLALNALLILICNKYTKRHAFVAPPELKYLYVMLCAPVAAVAISQVFKGSFYWNYYDSPVRFIVAVPILVTVVYLRLDTIKILSRVLPLALSILLAQVLYDHNAFYGTACYTDRWTNYFVDPLTLGSFALLLGTLCFVNITFHQGDWLGKSWNMLGFLLGATISVGTQSRTGWIALPFVMIVWGWINTSHYSRKWLIRTLVGGVLVVGFLATYSYTPRVKSRIDVALHEIKTYTWSSTTGNQTSIGERFSFLRMGAVIIGENWLTGWDDKRLAELLERDSFKVFASDASRAGLAKSGFHNELLETGVRTGIWGVISSFLLIIVPSLVAYRASVRGNPLCRVQALFGYTHVLFMVGIGLTSGVFVLKYATSLHAFLVASICGTLLWCKEDASDSTKEALDIKAVK